MMSCPSISDCCSSCLKSCCPKLGQKRSKFAYVKYSAGKEKGKEKAKDPCTPTEVRAAHKRTLSLPATLLTISPAKIFTFPQEKAPIIAHPQMFIEKEPVTRQPSVEFMRRFDSQTSTSSIGSEYSLYVAGGTLDDDLPPQRRQRTATMPARPSDHHRYMQDLREPSEEKTKRKKLTRKKSFPSYPPPADVQETYEWVPGLPVLQENTLEQKENRPSLQFSLHYDIHRCVLTVHLHHACNLPAMDRRGTSDPFVVLYLTPNKVEIFQSKTISRTLNPVYNQSFEFQGLTSDDIRRQTLIFRVYDHDKFSKNDNIGGVSLPLDGADLFGVVLRMRIEEGLKLTNETDTKGDLLLALSYNPQMKILKGLVLKATNLKKQDIVGLADPYIKIYLVHKHKREEKWKSSVKQKTLVPVYNEPFRFDLQNRDLEDVELEVFVMDYDRFSRNDAMGVVLLGKDVKHESGKKHWTDMLLSPQNSVSMWHTILPASVAMKPSAHLKSTHRS